MCTIKVGLILAELGRHFLSIFSQLPLKFTAMWPENLSATAQVFNLKPQINAGMPPHLIFNTQINHSLWLANYLIEFALFQLCPPSLNTKKGGI